MQWSWKAEPINETSSWEEIEAAHKRHEDGHSLGLTLGIVASVVIFLTWMRIGYENKWVEYSLFPATFFGGYLCYRIVYAIVVRFRA